MFLKWRITLALIGSFTYAVLCSCLQLRLLQILNKDLKNIILNLTGLHCYTLSNSVFEITKYEKINIEAYQNWNISGCRVINGTSRLLKDQNTRTVTSVVRYCHRGVINLHGGRCVRGTIGQRLP